MADLTDTDDSGSPPAEDRSVCPVCGRPVDKLRAGAMGIYGDTIRYFCGPDCKAQFGVASFPPPPPEAPAARPEAAVGVPSDGLRQARGAEHLREPQRAKLDGVEAVFTMPPPPPAEPAPSPAEGSALPLLRPELGTRRIALLIALGAVATGAPFVLPGTVPPLLVQGVCIVLLWGHLAANVLSVRRRGDRLEEALPLAASIVTAAAGVPAMTGGALSAAELPLGFAAAVAAIAAAGRAVETRLGIRAEREMRSMLQALPGSALIVRPEGEAETDLERVRAGEEVLVPTGEVAPVDGLVRSGDATILPLPLADHEERVSTGDLVIAGARVVHGELRLVATFVGAERSFARASRLPSAPTAPAPLIKRAIVASHVATGVAIAGGILVAALRLSFGERPFLALTAAAAFLLALSGHALRRVGASPLAACVGRAATRGAFFRDAAAIEAAARVATMVLPARGTLTAGIPSVTDVERIGDRDEAELLGLAAAAAAAAAPEHPMTQGLTAAAAARSMTLPEVRRPAYRAGGGVLGAAPGGEALVVGSRRLLLSEGVSIAAADEIVGRLEARGRTTILVAIAGKVQAVIGLHDEPRADSRPAVLALAALGIEPVLFTGDSRTTAESLGEALGVDHVRAEVEPEERATEVRRLTESGTTVAVIGHPSRDGAALDSADVAIALRWAGAPQGEPAIRLAGDRVSDAVQALAQARQALAGIRRNITIASGAIVLGGILAIGGLLPPPAAALVSSVAAVLVARTDRARVTDRSSRASR